MKKYHGVFYGVISIPENIVMNLNNVMEVKTLYMYYDDRKKKNARFDNE